MKHIRITRMSRLRAVRRWPGKIYRSTIVRQLVTVIAVWEFVYFGTIWVYGRHDEASLDLLTWAGLFATLLWLAGVTFWEVLASRKFMKEGVEQFEFATRRYALSTLALIHSRHGSIDSIPAPDGKRAVRCGCGQYIGLTTHGLPAADPKVAADWEKHLTEQVKAVMDGLEGEFDARKSG